MLLVYFVLFFLTGNRRPEREREKGKVFENYGIWRLPNMFLPKKIIKQFERDRLFGYKYSFSMAKRNEIVLFGFLDLPFFHDRFKKKIK